MVDQYYTWFWRFNAYIIGTLLQCRPPISVTAGSYVNNKYLQTSHNDAKKTFQKGSDDLSPGYYRPKTAYLFDFTAVDMFYCHRPIAATIVNR